MLMVLVISEALKKNSYLIIVWLRFILFICSIYSTYFILYALIIRYLYLVKPLAKLASASLFVCTPLSHPNMVASGSEMVEELPAHFVTLRRKL